MDVDLPQTFDYMLHCVVDSDRFAAFVQQCCCFFVLCGVPLVWWWCLLPLLLLEEEETTRCAGSTMVQLQVFCKVVIVDSMLSFVWVFVRIVIVKSTGHANCSSDDEDFCVLQRV